MRYCHFGIAPVNYSDSDSEFDCLIKCIVSVYVGTPDICCNCSNGGLLVDRNGPEWAKLPEWTTGMDLNMCP